MYHHQLQQSVHLSANHATLLLPVRPAWQMFHVCGVRPTNRAQIIQCPMWSHRAQFVNCLRPAGVFAGWILRHWSLLWLWLVVCCCWPSLCAAVAAVVAKATALQGLIVKRSSTPEEEKRSDRGQKNGRQRGKQSMIKFAKSMVSFQILITLTASLTTNEMFSSGKPFSRFFKEIFLSGLLYCRLAQVWRLSILILPC